MGSDNIELGKKIKDYWEDEDTVSIIDKNLHTLEIETVLNNLQSSDHIADIGCGNGEASMAYANKVKNVRAIERSDRLRELAEDSLKVSGKKNITFEKGDILGLTDINKEFDAVVTQRVLINLVSWDDQKNAIMNIHRSLKDGGRYIMVENTNEAFRNLNAWRENVDLKPIKQHFHNRFFDEKLLRTFMNEHFELIQEYNFGLYYFITRIYLQMFASFEGFGANAKKDSIFATADKAAFDLYNKFVDRVKFSESISPIQVFVFKRNEG